MQDVTKHTNYRISPWIIWLSSLSLGVLASVPKIAERHFSGFEALVNSGVTFLFSVFVWYYNIYALSRHTPRDKHKGFSIMRLLVSLLVGMGIMLLLAYGQQFLLSHLDFGPTMLMIEVRGILINLMFYMFVHLVYQGYQNQQVGFELERSKADNLGAQYEMLKQQVNPHFLFNNMNTLKAMVESQDEHTVEFILKLSDFYRFTLESRKHDLIPLSTELEIVNAYMFLLKARFEEGIHLENTIDPQYYTTLVPPFTLQLLIENCIKHNVVSLARPLQIKLYVAGDQLVVENKLQPKKSQETSTRVGLENINLRYQHLLHKKVEIEADAQTFKVKLPVIHGHSHH